MKNEPPLKTPAWEATGGPAQCLVGGSEGMVLFRRLAARAKRFALSRHNKHEKYKNTTTHGASEPNDTTHEVTK